MVVVLCVFFIMWSVCCFFFFFFNDTATTEIYTLSLHDALPIFAGNRKFLTRRLWDSANQPPYFHHGRFTTMRQAILAHAGEALAARQAFEAFEKAGQDAVIEFLKTLQVLPPGMKDRIVDENFEPKQWPPNRGIATTSASAGL